MKYKLILLTYCIMAAMLLSGCLKSGGSSDSASFTGGSYSTGGSTGGGSIPNNPEPATIALLGSGLAAYAFLKFKNRKK